MLSKTIERTSLDVEASVTSALDVPEDALD
jgi:hypothetical protein